MPAAANDIDIFRHVAMLLRGEEPVDAFIDWFWSAYSSIDLKGTDEAYDLSNSVANLLYQLDGGYIDETGLVSDLRLDAAELGIEWEPATVGGASRIAS